MNNRVSGVFKKSAALAMLSFGLFPYQAFSAEFEARIGHLESAQQPRHQALLKVASLVSERTSGAVDLTFFPSSQLGTQRQMTEGTQLGVIQGTVSPAAFLGGFNKVVSVLDIPYLYPTNRELSTKIRSSEFGQAILESFEGTGTKAIALWPNGRKNFTSNEPLENAKDFNDQRFRVMNSKVLIAQFNALGSSALPLPFGELYTSLQTGVVDGEENPLDTIFRMKFHEVQKYLVISEHGAMEDIVLFNSMWWNSLPKKYQEAITTAFNEVIPELERNKDSSVENALAEIKKSDISIKTLNEAERTELRDIMYPKAKAAYLSFAGEKGEELLTLYEKAYQSYK
ncbi:TRAP transporter substrate-binding protein [Marinomonas colpomeniae]|uniref:TRAP transporter substrate-binding protein n=1 Tax=Marinomonas colpomeniae TaxID=2774408 RepID=A0ABR8NZ46_9GAMM|nr:TRAP transporter substrate-binding protein [Marinomonas colpomeniae]MBD5771320.1 TRAP transporter substrate-binding protein [Marinomonas colpomeniae]